ncbi:MAG: hypothetical protein HKN73_06175 [Gemmatimonadetes bacterium]|nr:hypothetical protein [Gemmatimonadota bacterium]
MSGSTDAYAAATTGTGLVVRGDRRLLRVYGRAPVQMLQGILTQTIPPAPVDGSGERRYGALLTPKGKMVSDVKLLWMGPTEAEGLALDLSESGLESVLEVFRKSLPPRFAKIDDGRGFGLVTVVGDGARRVLGSWLGGDAPEGFLLHDGGPLQGGALVARGLRQPRSWDVWVPNDRVDDVVADLVGLGCSTVDEATWEVLRIEEGYPRFGEDMSDTTIPIEAGLEDVAFDHGKGCYTGQEVIIRIRHRGHVNRHLRFLLLGEWDPTALGDERVELFHGDAVRPVGWVTSAVASPRFGQTVGLGYVRREVEPPASVRLGGADGSEVGVRIIAGPARPR